MARCARNFKLSMLAARAFKSSPTFRTSGWPRPITEWMFLRCHHARPPRWAEQFGRVLVEALWCGVPVIGSQSGEIPWVIESTGGGLTFPEGDVDALRGCLEVMRADPALRTRLAKRGRERVERMFSVDAVARRFAEQLEAIVPGFAHASHYR